MSFIILVQPDSSIISFIKMFVLKLGDRKIGVSSINKKPVESITNDCNIESLILIV